MPNISVIIPVYNVVPYFRECVDSVIHQTFSDIEIILVDDGSTDESGQICDEYKEIDKRVSVIHQKNGGLGHARNVGMDRAKGKYIIFLDSDDYWSSDTLEILFSEAEKNQTQVLQFSAEPFWDGMEPDLTMTSMYTHKVQNGMLKNGVDSIKIALENREYFPSACMRFYRLDYLQENQLYFDEGVLHEDEGFSFLAYIGAERVECIENRFYKRRYRPGSIMTSKATKNSAIGYATALDRLLAVYRSGKLMSIEEKTLFEQRMRFYFNLVKNLYLSVVREDAKAARELETTVHKSLRAYSEYVTISSWLDRIFARNLYLGYWVAKGYSFLRRCGHKIKRMFFRS